MLGSGKIALMGLSNFTLIPVLKNDEWSYELEADKRFELPGVKKMSIEQETSRETVWADNKVYLDLHEYLGSKVTISIAGVNLELLEKLGFGEFDEEGVFDINPIGSRQEFSLAFACKQANDEYRMHRMHVFTINEIKESNHSSLGDKSGIAYYEIEGEFVPRQVDRKTAQVRDGKDLDWLTSGFKNVSIL